MGSVLAVRPTEISDNISLIFQISYLALLRCDIRTGVVGEGKCSGCQTNRNYTYDNISWIFQIPYLALPRCDIRTGVVGDGE